MAALLETEVTGAREAVVHLSDYSRHIQDFRALWPDITEAFIQRERLWFGAEGEGTWPALSPAYAEQKAKTHPGRPLLVREGSLRDSLITPRAVLAETEHMLVLGSSDKTARFHQGGTSRMPARPPLIPVMRFKAAIARLLDLWISYKPGFGSRIR